MEIVSYEKAADQNKYMYIMHWDSMHSVNYRFHDNHIHRAVEMVICEDGMMSYKSPSSVGTISSKQILIFNSFDKHFYEYVGEFKGYIIVLSMDFLNDVLVSQAYEFNNVLTINDKDWKQICKILEKTFSENDKMTFFEKKAQVLLLFNKLCKYDLIRDKREINIKDISTQILEYIEKNYSSDLTLKSISYAFGYSPNYFSSLFAKILGSNISFKSYLNQYRYKKVQEIKKDPKYMNDSLKVIIKRCGFNSFDSYYRAVKKYSKIN